MPGINMKMVQQMQNRMMKIQQELAETTIEGTAGGGVVTVHVNGH
jgi:DNA-binding protein YbaB